MKKLGSRVSSGSNTSHSIRKYYGDPGNNVRQSITKIGKICNHMKISKKLERLDEVKIIDKISCFELEFVEKTNELRALS